MNYKLRQLFGKFLIAFLVISTFVALFPLMWKYSGLRRKEKGFPGDVLQVLVVTPEEVEIVYSQTELDEYERRHPDYSFLVPSGQEARINEQLVAVYRQEGRDALPWVKVEQLGEGRQYLEVGVSGDPSELVVWYEATDKEVFPRYSQRFGAMLLLLMVMLTAGLTGLLWLVGFVVYIVIRG